VHDLLECVFDFLNPKEFAIVNTLSKKFHLLTSIKERFWKKHISARWELSYQFIDKILLNQKNNLIYLYRYASPIIQKLQSDDETIETIQCEVLSHKVIFSGEVGVSNRSVQSATPFPTVSFFKKESYIIEECSKLFTKVIQNFFCCMKIKTDLFDNYYQDEKNLILHSTPFAFKLNNDSPTTIQYYSSPNCISYYEVEVLQNNNTAANHVPNHHSNYQNECIAVGLATKAFNKKERLPGWDADSFGYHSDDGAIYHGKGRKLSSFGPTFSFNDTIGCGINHENCTIFFTLNGVLLGTAFQIFDNDFVNKNDVSKISMKNIFKKNKKCLELYPTVGIDAEAILNFNFGMKPFKFDLVNFIEKVVK
jgi:hypothetical protein